VSSPGIGMNSWVSEWSSQCNREEESVLGTPGPLPVGLIFFGSQNKLQVYSLSFQIFD